jgi:sulfite reductase (ferredoxin)
VARQFGDGGLHLTSRQDVQVHGVLAAGIPAAVARLTDAGLSTKGGGGNTVRNLAACDRAGVCADELFDITPHAIGLTEALVADPLSFQLPRKYKIAFSGCGRDCGGATVNDLGFIARKRDGQEGFAVYVGGGMGAQSAVGQLLEVFVPADGIGRVAEAVKRVFDRHGNRKNKHRARLRFLIADLGFERFVELYRQELSQAELAVTPRPLPAGIPERPAQAGAPAGGFAAWRAANVSAQKQPGYHAAVIAPPLGNLSAAALAGLADVVARHGEGMLRATNRQNLVLRWLREEELPPLHATLLRLGLANAEPAMLRDMVTCAGAATCRLGICLSRGLAGAIRTTLATSGTAWRRAADHLRLHISGCPNSCGRHPIADIGLSGAARRVNGHLAPFYLVQLGGHVEEGKTSLATGSALVPAKRIPQFLAEFLSDFAESESYPDFAAYLATGGREVAGELAARHATLPEFAESPEMYKDWDAVEPFTLAGRGPAECGAGVFDLIALDLAAAHAALRENRLLAATVAAARALLPTRGEEAANDAEAVDLFRRHFVRQDLVPTAPAALLDRAAAALADPGIAFAADAAEVGRLLTSVGDLYQAMGPSLRL